VLHPSTKTRVGRELELATPQFSHVGDATEGFDPCLFHCKTSACCQKLGCLDTSLSKACLSQLGSSCKDKRRKRHLPGKEILVLPWVSLFHLTLLLWIDNSCRCHHSTSSPVHCYQDQCQATLPATNSSWPWESILPSSIAVNSGNRQQFQRKAWFATRLVPDSGTSRRISNSWPA